MALITKHKYQDKIEKFAKVLDSGIRPAEFNRAYAYVQDKVSGFYRSENEALWEFLATHDIKSFVEIGRNLSGTLFMIGCACRTLKEVLSIDINRYEPSDSAIERWFNKHDISATIIEQDSTTFIPFGLYDAVLIDGDHKGEVVKKEIQIWKDRCKYLIFHDYADNGKNKHKRVFQDVVDEITKAKEKYGWVQIGERGRSEVIFKTMNSI